MRLILEILRYAFHCQRIGFFAGSLYAKFPISIKHTPIVNCIFLLFDVYIVSSILLKTQTAWVVVFTPFTREALNWQDAYHTVYCNINETVVGSRKLFLYVLFMIFKKVFVFRVISRWHSWLISFLDSLSFTFNTIAADDNVDRASWSKMLTWASIH